MSDKKPFPRAEELPTPLRRKTGSADERLPVAPPSETVVGSVPPGTELRVGTVLRDRFVLEGEIGRGGMGLVYRARDLRREEAGDRKKYVAIKVLGQHLKHHPDAMIALQREARRAQQLAHPNIATVYDFDREGEIAYLSMELLQGRGLHEVLRDSAPHGLSLDEAMPIVQGMAKGLAYAHQRGIVHADFKPGNVFLDEDGTVKILDFGIARVMPRPDQTTDTRFDAARWGALTPAYASCEMFQRLNPDPRDDVYGLACVTYELLAGRHPFRRLAATRARDEGITPAPIRGLTRRQNQALRHGLAFAREQRTASTLAFLDELAPATDKRVSRSAIGLAAVGVASFVAAVGVAVWLQIRVQAVEPVPPAGADVPADRTPPESIAPQVTPAAFEAGPVSVDPETQQKIDRILEVATLHLAMGRLVTPEGSNAAEAYAAVIELQPGNRPASDGLAAVAVRLQEQARALANDGNRADALALIERGLEWVPDHPGLARLRGELLH